MKIREIEKRDNAVIAKIIRNNLEKYGLNIKGTAYFDDCLDNLFDYYNDGANKGKYWVLTTDKDEVVGGVGFYHFPEIKNCAELQKIYLKEEFKGKGYGKFLLDYLIKEVKKYGYESIYLETHHNLDIAVKMYLKFGFNEIKRPFFVVHSTMDVFMIKNI